MSTRLYLYNGYEYAVLPSRDKTKYRYGMLCKASDTRFVYSDNPFTLDTTQNKVVAADGAIVYTRIYNATAKTWNGAALHSGTYSVDSNAVIWTNSDIVDGEGTVFLAATAPVFVETRPAPLSLKQFMTGLLNGLTDPQAPICDALPITGYAYNGVPLGKVPDEELVGHRFAVIYGGTAGKYHLCLFSARPLVYTGNGAGEDSGFIASSWYIDYKLFANYSVSNENVLLREWQPFYTDEIAQSGRIDYEITLEDDFIKAGILWSSFDLYGDDAVLRKKATHIYPVSEVIGSG